MVALPNTFDIQAGMLSVSFPLIARLMAASVQALSLYPNPFGKVWVARYASSLARWSEVYSVVILFFLVVDGSSPAGLVTNVHAALGCDVLLRSQVSMSDKRQRVQPGVSLKGFGNVGSVFIQRRGVKW
jgi:hypothetical protein